MLFQVMALIIKALIIKPLAINVSFVVECAPFRGIGYAQASVQLANSNSSVLREFFQ
jgi:hypothetical protein